MGMLCYLLHPSQGEVSGTHCGQAARRHGSWQSAAHQEPSPAPSRGRQPLTTGLPGAWICHLQQETKGKTNAGRPGVWVVDG